MPRLITAIVPLLLLACSPEDAATTERDPLVASPNVSIGIPGANGSRGETGPMGPTGPSGASWKLGRGTLEARHATVVIVPMSSAGVIAECPTPHHVPLTGGCMTSGDRLSLTTSVPTDLHAYDRGARWMCAARNDSLDLEGELRAYVVCVLP
jgi:hypothetical protein